MAALKEVRQRITSVRGIEQVTKAMKMVATVKMRRVAGRVTEFRSYVDALLGMAGKLVSAAEDGESRHVLMTDGPGSAELMIVIGADRGLCGAFNINLARTVGDYARDRECDLVVVGRKVRTHFAHQKHEIVREYGNLQFPVSWREAEKMARDLVNLFSFRGYRRAMIAHQRFVSAGSSRPVVARWIPFHTDAGAGDGRIQCEPSVSAVLEAVLPRALTGQLYLALLESQASEQGARMVAMDNAATNAGELAGDLVLLANKLRQSGITKELLEITTGAEALNN